MSGPTSTPRDWRDDAACRHYDGEHWYELRGGADEARNICNNLCPARAECLDWSLRNDVAWGIWAGLDEHQRRAERRRLGIEPAPMDTWLPDEALAHHRTPRAFRLGDIDENTVARRCQGDTTAVLTRTERLEVVRRLADAGHSNSAIAHRTGIHQTQVHRDRATLRQPAHLRRRTA